MRPSHPLLNVHPTVSGTSLSADDDVVLMLDPSGLAGRPHDVGLVALAPPALIPSCSSMTPSACVEPWPPPPRAGIGF